jgi:hypothetical protein
MGTALNVVVFDRPFPPIDLQGLARYDLLRKRQRKWDAALIFLRTSLLRVKKRAVN